MRVSESSIPVVLKERARRRPNDTAFTFVDYGVDPAGFSESLTWSQVYQRAQRVAAELAHCGSVGDRAVISRAAEPRLHRRLPRLHSRPDSSRSPCRSRSAASPTSVSFGAARRLTHCHSHDIGCRRPCRRSSHGAARTIRSIDHRGRRAGPGRPDSVRAGCQRPHRRLPDHGVSAVHLRIDPAPGRGDDLLYEPADQHPADHLRLFSGSRRGCPTGHHRCVVAALLSRHGPAPGDMRRRFTGEISTVVTSPMSFLQRPARWMQLMASNSQAFTAAPNFAFELAARKTSDDDMAGCDLGDVFIIVSGAERVHPATLKRFTDRFAQFNLPRVIRPSYGLAEATLYVATRRPGAPPEIVHFESEKLSAGQAKRCATVSAHHWSATARRCSITPGANRRSGDPHRVPGGKDRRDLGARRQRRHGLLAEA